MRKAQICRLHSFENQKISQLIWCEEATIQLKGPKSSRSKLIITRAASTLFWGDRGMVGHVTDPGIDVLEVLESMTSSQNFQKKCRKRLSRFQMHHLAKKRYRGTLGSCERRSPLPSMERMPRTWTMRSISSYQERQLWAGFTSQMSLLRSGRSQPLDKEALNRATSAYVTDRVVPMLPERLSNGGDPFLWIQMWDRPDPVYLIMEIDPHGKVVGHTITQTVINTTSEWPIKMSPIFSGDEEKARTFKENCPKYSSKWPPRMVF